MTPLIEKLRTSLRNWLAGSSKDSELKVFLKENGKLPMKKRPQDAGFDFYVDFTSTTEQKTILLQPGEVKRFSTGCHCGFPPETMWLWDVRSSVGLKGLDVTCRTIDNEYRGELSVVVVNNGQTPLPISHGDRIAQLIPNPFSSKYCIKEVKSKEELGETSRGEKGFGSSGKN